MKRMWVHKAGEGHLGDTCVFDSAVMDVDMPGHFEHRKWAGTHRAVITPQCKRPCSLLHKALNILPIWLSDVTKSIITEHAKMLTEPKKQSHTLKDAFQHNLKLHYISNVSAITMDNNSNRFPCRKGKNEKHVYTNSLIMEF